MKKVVVLSILSLLAVVLLSIILIDCQSSTNNLKDYMNNSEIVVIGKAHSIIGADGTCLACYINNTRVDNLYEVRVIIDNQPEFVSCSKLIEGSTYRLYKTQSIIFRLPTWVIVKVDKQ